MCRHKQQRDGKERVLLVHNYYRQAGGEDAVVANEKRILEERGHVVISYFRSNAEPLSLWQRLLLPAATIFNLRTYREIRQLIHRHHIDIVHVHNTLALISPAVYYAARNCGVPVVQTIHNFRFLCSGALFYRDGKVCEECVRRGRFHSLRHRCYRNSFPATLLCACTMRLHQAIFRYLNFICLTSFNREKLLLLNQRERESIINPAHVFIKPNCTVPQRPVPQQGLPDLPKTPFILFAARLTEEKGIRLILETWRKMGESAPDLVLCGTGPEEKACQEAIRKNMLSKIHMVGHLPQPMLRSVLSRAQALLLPSLWYEGFPMSMAESYAAGIPVIGSDLGNVGDIIRHYGGLTFTPNSPDSLAAAIRQLLRNPPTLRYENLSPVISPEANYRILRDIYRRSCS